MHKKLILTILAVLLFAGIEFLNAQETPKRPQVLKHQQKQVQRKHTQKAGKQKVSQKEGKRKTGRSRQKAATVRPKRGQAIKIQKTRTNRPAVRKTNQAQTYQRWFGGLKKAYRENDRKKMGRLIRIMEQRQKQIRKQAPLKRQQKKSVSQKAMHRRRRGNRRHGWVKSNYQDRHRLGTYPRSRSYGGDFIESYRNPRPRLRMRRDRHRPERRRYHRL